MTKEEARKLIAEKVEAAQKALHEAEKLADQHGIGFGFHPAYGMGGYYQPEVDETYGEDWSPSNTGWLASSQSC